ncbi:Uma2 family endonuclease [Lentibacillus lipolyticus]|nr:Uma2 family endonuclease [Lentibacillus lipolyticus]
MANKKHPDKVNEHPMTYADYAALPDDGFRYELASGTLQAMSPSPHPMHQLVSHELSIHLKQSCQDEYVTLSAPVDVILSDKEVRQPDLVMIHRDRLPIITDKGIEGSPDLVVEILSPSSVKRDRKEKMKIYAAYAIPEYWLVDPKQQTLEQYVLKESRYDLQEVYLEGHNIVSNHIRCVSFSMNDIFSAIPELPNA